MATIFSDALGYFADCIRPATDKFHKHNRVIKIVIFSLISVLAITASLAISGARLAFKVNYEGEVIATVRSKSQFESAIDIVKHIVNNNEVDKAVSEPQYTAAIVPASVIDSEDTVAEAIIEKTDEIIPSCLVTVNGAQIACVKKETLDEYLNTRFKQYEQEGYECKSGFVENVVFEDGYSLSSDVAELDAARDALSTLTVKTILTGVHDVEANFNTITRVSNDYPIGYSQTQVEGQKGSRRVTESITYINGVESSRAQISDEILTAPIDRIVIVGNAKPTVSAEQKSLARDTGFIFPLPKHTWTATSYYGDGRNHRGIDLAASSGTTIMAVADGTVTFAGTYSSYGNCVIIDHGNGYSTLYAHASKLCVSAGEHVSAGETIALVGCTGNASGNHLHFEVIKGSERVNPAPYIGINH